MTKLSSYVQFPEGSPMTSPTTKRHSEKVGASPLGLVSAAGLILISVGCAAPGMKLNTHPGSTPTTTRTDGMEVTVRSLNTPGQRLPEPPATESSDLTGLLVDKLPPYQVGPQDILLVTVWDHPEISLPLGQFRTDNGAGMVVDEDGYLFFPYVGKLAVKGLTTSQVREALTTQLGNVLRNPQVDVKVIAYRSQKIFVGGEVRNPAVYNVTDVPFTLAEAVNRAGGFSATADDSRLLLTRGNRTWKLNFHALMGTGNRIGQILLKDGDSLHVSSAAENTVYAMGELVRPGSIPMMHGNLTLAQAISDAGGIQVASPAPSTSSARAPPRPRRWTSSTSTPATPPPWCWPTSSPSAPATSSMWTPGPWCAGAASGTSSSPPSPPSPAPPPPPRTSST